MNLDNIASIENGELALRVRHLRGLNSTNPAPSRLVELAEDSAAFLQGYARALKHMGRISQEEFAALVHEILETLDGVYRLYCPEKAADADPSGT
ncbi:hypothetical protein ACE0DR_26855 [Azotobacter sp. CWF10]